LADPVYFDSSVFLAIFIGEASGPDIKELLKELRRDKVRVYTSIVTIQEVSVKGFRKGASRIEDAGEEVSGAKIQTEHQDTTRFQKHGDGRAGNQAGGKGGGGEVIEGADNQSVFLFVLWVHLFCFGCALDVNRKSVGTLLWLGLSS
jgi:hypothetical protein